jgi:hypothetical protein
MPQYDITMQEPQYHHAIQEADYHTATQEPEFHPVKQYLRTLETVTTSESTVEYCIVKHGK